MQNSTEYSAASSMKRVVFDICIKHPNGAYSLSSTLIEYRRVDSRFRIWACRLIQRLF